MVNEATRPVKTVGFIGSGQIGATVARLAVAADYHVVLSNSRSPETLQDLVADLGPRARAATPAEAAASGDLVVVAIPFLAYRAVPVEPLAGKTVIESTNYYPQRDGHITELDDESTSVAALIQEHLPESHVVKVFNNIFFGHLATLARPSGAGDRSALAIAGDNADAKAKVISFLDRVGYDAVDAGGLVEERRFRPETPAYAVPYSRGRQDFWAVAGSPVPAAELRVLLAAADSQPGAAAGRLPDGFGA
jgi:8-hydroxy-5-deazaflavin:NADPH oxidoreductase